MVWATVDDVNTLLGVTVDAPTLSKAVRSLEAITGLIESVERPDITDRDLYWLKLAVCYQSAWLLEQPDYLARNDVSAASQSGESVTLKADGLVLAPMARRSIKRLTWRGARSILPDRTPDSRTVAMGLDSALAESTDDLHEWQPL